MQVLSLTGRSRIKIKNRAELLAHVQKYKNEYRVDREALSRTIAACGGPLPALQLLLEAKNRRDDDFRVLVSLVGSTLSSERPIESLLALSLKTTRLRRIFLPYLIVAFPHVPGMAETHPETSDSPRENHFETILKITADSIKLDNLIDPSQKAAHFLSCFAHRKLRCAGRDRIVAYAKSVFSPAQQMTGLEVVALDLVRSMPAFNDYVSALMSGAERDPAVFDFMILHSGESLSGCFSSLRSKGWSNANLIDNFKMALFRCKNKRGGLVALKKALYANWRQRSDDHSHSVVQIWLAFVSELDSQESLRDLPKVWRFFSHSKAFLSWCIDLCLKSVKTPAVVDACYEARRSFCLVQEAPKRVGLPFFEVPLNALSSRAGASSDSRPSSDSDSSFSSGSSFSSDSDLSHTSLRGASPLTSASAFYGDSLRSPLPPPLRVRESSSRHDELLVPLQDYRCS
ncbi:MAG: hypothetical protein COW05_03550 [Gammaproteobacteria bacterium CG12_big_fil_rev_8_21_14_0_65_46_12]|nr:MAG: hypothetical protein COW05_03550 [Gammaproteobacteria bacterium CG12_big_fil_rev_8_21_14_0_65_46_12]